MMEEAHSVALRGDNYWLLAVRGEGAVHSAQTHRPNQCVCYCPSTPPSCLKCPVALGLRIQGQKAQTVPTMSSLSQNTFNAFPSPPQPDPPPFPTAVDQAPAWSLKTWLQVPPGPWFLVCEMRVAPPSACHSDGLTPRVALQPHLPVSAFVLHLKPLPCPGPLLPSLPGVFVHVVPSHKTSLPISAHPNPPSSSPNNHFLQEACSDPRGDISSPSEPSQHNVCHSPKRHSSLTFFMGFYARGEAQYCLGKGQVLSQTRLGSNPRSLDYDDLGQVT